MKAALDKLGVCPAVLELVGDCTDAAELWATCDRGDWMLWLLGRLSGPPESDARRKLVACCADAAETALQYVRDESARTTIAACLNTCRRWARSEATIAELRAASAAAAAAAYAASAYATASAAAAAAYAASAPAAASAAAYSAAASAAAVKAVYHAAAVKAVRDVAYDAHLADIANIVRRHYPEPPSLEAGA